MNKTVDSSRVYSQYAKDVEISMNRKNKEEEVTKNYGKIDPDSFDKHNRTLDKDIQKFKMSSEAMLSQLDEYEKKKK